jgi:hypothetical protein
MSSFIHPDQLLGLLADPARLRITAALALEPVARSALPAAAGLGARDAAEAAERLERAGVIEEVDGRLRVVPGLFVESVRAAAALRPAGVDDERARLISRHFHRGRLVQLPEQADVRRSVLDLVVAEFDVDVEYDEPAVNARLSVWHDDWCSLRRALVDHGLLTRQRSVYRRPASPAPTP